MNFCYVLAIIIGFAYTFTYKSGVFPKKIIVKISKVFTLEIHNDEKRFGEIAQSPKRTKR